jgi:hypothetical protein
MAQGTIKKTTKPSAGTPKRYVLSGARNVSRKPTILTQGTLQATVQDDKTRSAPSRPQENISHQAEESQQGTTETPTHHCRCLWPCSIQSALLFLFSLLWQLYYYYSYSYCFLTVILLLSRKSPPASSQKRNALSRRRRVILRFWPVGRSQRRRRVIIRVVRRNDLFLVSVVSC